MTKNKTYEKKTIIHERLHQKLKNEQHKSTPPEIRIEHRSSGRVDSSCSYW